jgi:hypothetical protein
MQAVHNVEPSHPRKVSPRERDGAVPTSGAPPAATFTPVEVFWRLSLSTMALSWAMLLGVQRTITNTLGAWGMMAAAPHRTVSPGSGRREASDIPASAFDARPTGAARVGHADGGWRSPKTGRGTRSRNRAKSGSRPRRARAA